MKKKKTTITDKGTRHIVTSQNFTQKVIFYKVGVSRSLFGNTPCMQLFRGRLSEKLCTRQSRKVLWDMINALSLTLQLSNLLLLLFFSTRKHTSMASLVPFFEISLENSELKLTHNTFRGCRVHFFRQPFLKQLYPFSKQLPLVSDHLAHLGDRLRQVRL